MDYSQLIQFLHFRYQDTINLIVVRQLSKFGSDFVEDGS